MLWFILLTIRFIYEKGQNLREREQFFFFGAREKSSWDLRGEKDKYNMWPYIILLNRTRVGVGAQLLQNLVKSVDINAFYNDIREFVIP